MKEVLRCGHQCRGMSPRQDIYMPGMFGRKWLTLDRAQNKAQATWVAGERADSCGAV